MLDDTSPSGTCDLQEKIRRIMPGQRAKDSSCDRTLGVAFLSPARCVLKFVRRTPCSIGQGFVPPAGLVPLCLIGPEQGW